MTDLQRAIEYVGAVRVASGTYEYDEGNGYGWRYRVSGEDLSDLGARLRRGDFDAYSRWCAETMAVRIREAR